MTLALLLLVPLLLGAGAASACGIRRRADPLLWAAWCWALGGLGLGALVLCAWWLGLGARRGTGPGWIVGGALAAAAALALLGRRRARPDSTGPPAPPDAWRAAGGRERGLYRAVLALVLGLALDRILLASNRALSLGDEAHIWSVKAKAMYLSGGPGEGLSELLGRWYVSHADYPLLNPLLHLWSYSLAGRVVHVENRLCIQLFAVAALLALAAGLRHRVRPALAALLLLCASSAAPIRDLLRAEGSGWADGMVVAGATLACDAWLRHAAGEGRRWLYLWGAALALCAWSKNDGFLIASAFAGAALFAPVERRRLALALAPAAAVALLSFAFNAAHGLENDLLHKGGAPFWERAVELCAQRGPAVGGFFGREVLGSSAGSRLIWIAAAALAAAHPRRILRGPLLAPALFLGATLAGYAFVFLGTPLDLDGHLATAAARVAAHVLPAGALWLAAAAQALLPAPGSARRLECAAAPTSPTPA